MDQTTDALKKHIDEERELLGEDLSEIESRVKEATDWKTYFNENPGLALGAAAAGGFLLAVLMTKPSRPAGTLRDFAQNRSRDLRQATSTSSEIHHLSETADNILAAFVGMVSGKVCDFIDDAFPGFQKHYDEIARTSEAATPMNLTSAGGGG